MPVLSTPMKGKTSMSLTRNIIYYATSQGADFNHLLEAAQLTEASLNDPQFELDMEKSSNLWNAAMLETRDMLFGLHLGEQSNPAVLGVVGHLFQTCPNLLEGMMNLQRFNYLFNSLVQLKIVETEDMYGLCFFIEDNSYQHQLVRRQAKDAWMSGITSIFTKMGASQPKPARVSLSPLLTAQTDEYLRVFKGSDVYFNREEDVLWYTKKTLGLPLVSSNPDMYAYFMRLANEQLEASIGLKSFARTIQDLLIKHYNHGFPGIEQLADQLHTTTRTMQRKLKAEGFTFSQLIEQAKQEMAFRLMKTRKYNISEVAYMLGFSEPGSFTRSFRKWTGKSPRAYFNTLYQPSAA